jgi:hypothetical protein
MHCYSWLTQLQDSLCSPASDLPLCLAWPDVPGVSGLCDGNPFDGPTVSCGFPLCR